MHRAPNLHGARKRQSLCRGRRKGGRNWIPAGAVGDARFEIQEACGDGLLQVAESDKLIAPSLSRSRAKSSEAAAAAAAAAAIQASGREELVQFWSMTGCLPGL
mmetsp:Transcript_8049/g.18000  ORF Transcript_8049/g.18000 Transcript_8049/m.18000 type:complete len:104 (-) Transcript_8049:74-385(-)